MTKLSDRVSRLEIMMEPDELPEMVVICHSDEEAEAAEAKFKAEGVKGKIIQLVTVCGRKCPDDLEQCETKSKGCRHES